MLHIDKYSNKPIYTQVVEHYCQLILSGEMQPGETFPSVRVVARESGINPNTLQRAYRVLEARGLCISSQGSSRYVTREALDILEGDKKKRSDELLALVAELKSDGVRIDEIIELVTKHYDEV